MRPEDRSSYAPRLAQELLDVVLTFGNDGEFSVELHVIALSLFTDGALNLVAITVHIDLANGRASIHAESLNNFRYVVQ